MDILNSVLGAQHPNPGRNIQHLLKIHMIKVTKLEECPHVKGQELMQYREAALRGPAQICKL